MTMKLALLVLIVFVELIDAAGVRAQSTVDFRREVQPILASRCYKCHGPNAAEGGLRLHDRTVAMAEVDSGERAIVPGRVDQSELLKRVSSTDESLRMPPEGKPLTEAQVDLLRRWIASGAEFRNHWAFEPVVRPSEPKVKNPSWVRNPIDAFVLQGLEQAGFEPAPPAEPVALIRRVYFDLTGLPPTPAEVDEFVSQLTSSHHRIISSSKQDDGSAYAALVDRLLDSPRYGERWARHWLDLVRYADTNSFERDGVKPNAWKFRDYVIKSFNDDKPYDQFVREQLAGDELPEPNKETITATGFYRLGLWDDEPADQKQARYDELDDIITTTAQSFLGLTVNCARCHDHKIDPIPQSDYYRLLAFVHELPSYGTRGNQGMASQTDVSSPEIAAIYEKHDAERHSLAGQMHEIEQLGVAKMPAEDQRTSEGAGRKKLLAEKLYGYLDPEQRKEHERLKAELERLEKRPLPPRDTVLSVAYQNLNPPETFIFPRGNPHLKGEKVSPGFPVAVSGRTSSPPVIERRPTTSGRRTALADWIASPANPLTARVIVNRVWQFHFGRGIVRSSSNFGFASTPPTHPELLDWLADEFVKQGWKLKTLHKLILTSNTYRQSSISDSESGKSNISSNPQSAIRNPQSRDPTNDRLWRFDMRRLSAEELRDAMLAVSGQLSLKMYGPGVYPKISPEVLAGQSRPGEGWGKSSIEDQARRSIYVHVKRSLILPMLAEFDFCDTDSSCAVRFVTTQPTQALGMINGHFAHEQAAALAERLKREVGPNAENRVERALRLAVGRRPTNEEIQRGVQLISSLEKKHQLSADDALKYYCLTVLNLNEFMYLD